MPCVSPTLLDPDFIKDTGEGLWWIVAENTTRRQQQPESAALTYLVIGLQTKQGDDQTWV